jgi:hypothetical protein
MMFEDVTTLIFDVGGTLYNQPALDEQYPIQLYHLLSTTRGISLEDAKTLLKQTQKELSKTLVHSKWLLWHI